MAFESLTLTPFCMEILGVRKWIFQCLTVFSVQFWLELGKNMQEYVNSLYFLQLFCRYSLFFSPGRDQLQGRAGQKNISPGISPNISPLLDFCIPGLDSSI